MAKGHQMPRQIDNTHIEYSVQLFHLLVLSSDTVLSSIACDEGACHRLQSSKTATETQHGRYPNTALSAATLKLFGHARGRVYQIKLNCLRRT